MNKNIKNVVFDFGGVLLNISYEKTNQAFKKLTGEEFRFFTQSFQGELFKDHECGKISNADFRQGIRELTQKDLADEEIDHAWNAMLGNFPLKRLVFLEELAKKYRLFLLSNTNAIHQKFFEEEIESTHGLNRFENVFEKIFYSHELGYRKPDVATFLHVADLAKILPQESLFIDDSIQHVEGAKKAGFEAVWLEKGCVTELPFWK